MIKKITAMLAMVFLFGFSTAYAHDTGYDDAAGAVLVAGFAVAAAAILLSSLDRHDEYRPAPRHVPDRPQGARGYEQYGHQDGRHGGDCQPRDHGRLDRGQYGSRYEQDGRGNYSGKKWDRR
jgi:hypothetical protein